jgi:hypothetical protein
MIGIGIDPGLTGALAFIAPGGAVTVEDIPTVDLPGNGLVSRRVDGLALARLIRQHVPAGHACTVLMESVHAMGGSAVQTMGSMMRSVGAIEAVLEVLRMPAAGVTPQTWKRFYGLKSDKGQSLTKARTLYPAAPLRLAKHHNRAEALLIAHYALQVLA